MLSCRKTVLSSALVGVVVASTSAYAGHCISAEDQSIRGFSNAAPPGYQPAIYTVYGGYRAAPAVRVRYHTTGRSNEKTAVDRQDIAEVVQTSEDLKTLVAAVNAAGLVDTLKGEGPFTVFAPSDQAFAKLPKDQLDALLQDTDALVRLLTYHIVPGEVTSSDVLKLSSAPTLEGRSILIDINDGVMVNDARVTSADIEANNGVIHVIDTVIIPN